MNELIEQAHKDMAKRHSTHGGKGDAQRPTNKDAFEANWDLIWGNKDEDEMSEMPSTSDK